MRDLKRSLKKSNNSSPGPDQIHYAILRHLPIETLHVLLDIINETWKSDTFPESWREALIISIPKPGKDHFNPLNYRPIALTSCICKTVERMVNERLVWYLEKNGLLAKQQGGYRSNRSTVDHLVRLETFIRDAFINNQHLVAVFFDLQKAYDTTWKYGILNDLHSMGLRGNLPIFIGNFLSDRTFQIHLGTILSDKIFHQEEGVPQGAILSTTLFDVKINDTVKQIDPGVECSLYVDDFVIMYRSPTIDAIQRKLQHTIHRLEKWTLENVFLQYAIKPFVNTNLKLQREEPQIHVLKKTLLALVRDLLIKFIQPWALTGKMVTSVNYKNPINQKKNEGLMIGELAKNMISDKEALCLRESKIKQFYNVVVDYYSSGLDYILKKLPVNEELLEKAQVADVSMQTTRSVQDLMYFVDRFPVLMPKCSRDELELEFANYQTWDFSSLSKKRIDHAWADIGCVEDEAGQFIFQNLSKVMMAILSIPHSNAGCERIFSMVRKNKTDQRASMSSETLNALMVLKSRAKSRDAEFSNEQLKKFKTAYAKSLKNAL